MQRSTTQNITIAAIAMTVLAVLVMAALHIATPTTAPESISTVSAVGCSYEPDAENIIYQSEAYGVHLTAAEASAVHAGLFIDQNPTVAMNASTSIGVRALTFAAQHGAITVFDTNTGDALPGNLDVLGGC